MLIRTPLALPAMLLVLSVLAAPPAAACTLEKTDYGLIAVNCRFVTPSWTLKMPNLVATGAGVRPAGAYSTRFDTSVTVRNNGQLGTDEALFRLVPHRLDPPPEEPDGRFMLRLRVEVRDLHGNRVLLREGSSGLWVHASEFEFPAGPLAAGSFVHRVAPVPAFELPDRNNVYDICLSAYADPPEPGLGGGRIHESSEADNTFQGFARLPGRDMGVDLRPTTCHQGPSFD